MKRFFVEQTGYVQIYATRRFVFEGPDDMDEQEVEEVVKDRALVIREDEGLAWKDDLDRKWSGYDEEIWDTHIHEADYDTDASLKGLTLVTKDYLQAALHAWREKYKAAGFEH